MPHSWRQPAEQINLFLDHQRTRVAGITSPLRGSGVSTLAARLSAARAASGVKTLLLDLNGSGPDGSKICWSPADPATFLPARSNDGYDVVVGCSGQRSLFNNVATLRQTFGVQLAGYEQIIVDLPALSATDTINPAAVAAACDGVLIVCVTGRSSAAVLRAAIAKLDAAGASVSGTVLNDAETPR